MMQAETGLDAHPEVRGAQDHALHVDEPRRSLNRAKESVGVGVGGGRGDHASRLAKNTVLRDGGRSDLDIPQSGLVRELPDERRILVGSGRIGQRARDLGEVPVEELTLFAVRSSQRALKDGGENEQGKKRHSLRTIDFGFHQGGVSMRPIQGIALGLMLVAPAAFAGAPRRVIDARTNALNKNDPPFSGAVKVGDTLYISGQIGLGPDRKPPADVTEEAKLVLESMKNQLVKAGMTMDDLVSVQVFCSDVKHYDAFNAVYRTYFTKEFPARAFLGSGTLLFGARFEVMGVAVKR